MAKPLRVSVRRMVEFTLTGGDIAPASVAAMLEGARGHRARQAQTQADNERAVRWTGEAAGAEVTVSGRVDTFWRDASPPVVEELKVLSDTAPAPDSPAPQHRMQAACYAFMLCEELALPAVVIRVSYITLSGETRAAFSQTLSAAQAREAFFAMLTPWADWTARWADIRLARDESLARMPFPYAAYRAGQREMAVQAYTAVSQRKRLFATLPTGTGKSAAALFPALKAMGAGKTRQVFYLTARGTAQEAAQDALRRMQNAGMRARYVTIIAKEKCCPMDEMRCHPAYCPRARGYFDRERDGQAALMDEYDWSPLRVAAVCDEHALCPFEFTLSLCEYADAVICDYNYAFDPMIVLRRVFEQGECPTLLIDEAHNLPERAREMLSGTLDSGEIARIRRETGALHGRACALYRAYTALLRALRALDEDCQEPPAALPGGLQPALETLTEQMGAGFHTRQAAGAMTLFRTVLAFQIAARRMAEQPREYRVLLTRAGRERQLRLFALNITDHLALCTRRAAGCVFFSATLSPLESMRALLGGDEQDAVFALPSPFPPERLLVLQCDADTRYHSRAATARRIAGYILAMYEARAGKYIAFFPSYQYMELVRGELLSLRPDLTLNAQARGMGQEARAAFLARLRGQEGALLSLCVLGGVFSEGVDLPGLMLIGVAVVGVGLPQVCPERELLRGYFDQTLGGGFGYAYRYPGMHKVLQAAGRVIRDERDAGVALLIDSRYAQGEYARLLPPHFHVRRAADAGEISARAQEFWALYGNNTQPGEGGE